VGVNDIGTEVLENASKFAHESQAEPGWAIKSHHGAPKRFKVGCERSTSCERNKSKFKASSVNVLRKLDQQFFHTSDV
jgi:hypothetical protein